jgi:hypothetical protein
MDRYDKMTRVSAFLPDCGLFVSKKKKEGNL